MLQLAHLEFVSMLNYVIQVHVASRLHVTHDSQHLPDTLQALHVILLKLLATLLPTAAEGAKSEDISRAGRTLLLQWLATAQHDPCMTPT